MAEIQFQYVIRVLTFIQLSSIVTYFTCKGIDEHAILRAE
jgi:hypothetical protein